jgi:hypothetical protein
MGEVMSTIREKNWLSQSAWRKLSTAETTSGTGGVFDERTPLCARLFLGFAHNNGASKDHYGDPIDKVESFRNVSAGGI